MAEWLKEPGFLGTQATIGADVSQLMATLFPALDAFVYYASMGMDMDQQKRSLQLFIDKVAPTFADREVAHAG